MRFKTRPAMLISVAGMAANFFVAHQLSQIPNSNAEPTWLVFLLAAIPFVLLIAARHRCHRNSKRFAVDLFASSAALLPLILLVDPTSFQMLHPSISVDAGVGIIFCLQATLSAIAMTIAWGLRRHSFRLNSSMRVSPSRAAL